MSNTNSLPKYSTRNKPYTNHDIVVMNILSNFSGLTYQESIDILKKTKKQIKKLYLNNLKPEDFDNIIKEIKSEIANSKPLKLVDDFEGLKGVPTKFWSPIEIMEKQLIPCYKRMEKEGKVLSPSAVANHLYFLSLSFHIQHKDHFQVKDEFYDSLLDLCQKQTSGQTQES